MDDTSTLIAVYGHSLSFHSSRFDLKNLPNICHVDTPPRCLFAVNIEHSHSQSPRSLPTPLKNAISICHVKFPYILPSILQHSIIRHLNYVMHFLSTKLSSVDLPPDDDYNAHCTTLVRSDLSYNGGNQCAGMIKPTCVSRFICDQYFETCKGTSTMF